MGELKVGDIVTNKENQSTSRSVRAAMNFASKKAHIKVTNPGLMIIKPKPFEGASQRPTFAAIEKSVPKEFRSEKEVIQRRNTKLKITKVTTMGRLTIINLEEVD